MPKETPKEKICPLKFDLPQRRVTRETDWACDKACAWWDNFTGLCAISVIARFGSVGSFYVERQEMKTNLKLK